VERDLRARFLPAASTEARTEVALHPTERQTFSAYVESFRTALVR
jgi:hypothetical protein